MRAPCIARQIARGKRAATADTRVLAPAHPSQVHTHEIVCKCEMERANGYSGVTWCKWSAPMWYGGAHGGFYETLTSLVYFALCLQLHYLRPTLVRMPLASRSAPLAAYLQLTCSPRLPHTELP